MRVQVGDYEVWTDASGVVTNSTDEELDFVRVGVIAFGAKNEILGYMDPSVYPLAAGKSKAFKSDTGFMPAALVRLIKSTKVFAYELQY